MALPVISVTLAERDPSSPSPPVYKPGSRINVVVVVKVTQPVQCSSLDVALVIRGEGKGLHFSDTDTNRMLFSGDWPAGTHRYDAALDAPAGPASFHGSLVTADWYVAVHAQTDDGETSTSEPFEVAPLTLDRVELVFPETEDAASLVRIRGKRHARTADRKRAGRILDLVGVAGLLVFAAGLVMRYAHLSPSSVTTPLTGIGGFVGGLFVVLLILSFLNKRYGDLGQAAIDVAVALSRGCDQHGDDSVNCVAYIERDVSIDAMQARLDVFEFVEWARPATHESSGKLSERSSVYHVTRDMSQVQPGQWSAALPLQPQLPCTIEDVGGHGVLWEVEVLVTHSGGKTPESPVVRRLRARPRRETQ